MNPDSQNTVQKKLSNPMTGDLGRLLLVVVALIADQVSKYMARKNFGLPGGEPDYFHIKQVLGEWVQFRLVYNTGAAFGLRPQSVLPFLNPTVLITGTAVIVAEEPMAVAAGNLKRDIEKYPHIGYWFPNTINKHRSFPVLFLFPFSKFCQP